MLLQTLGREMLVLDYELNKVRITELYCVNKARPQLHCNGKCHLAQELRKADGADKKSPAGAVAKVKYEVLPTVAFVLAPQPQRWPLGAQCYPARPTAHCAAVPSAEVFRPPLLFT
ncbi:hypothetical protein [Hymenobacter terrenus]|uniref:hypothetical protein n=1 Tax=Hymenobacter terrenus TaxID=1629124 RepID=UPI000AE91FF9|nr:hypothetical protein [Hymenobacter terrenus]